MPNPTPKPLPPEPLPAPEPPPTPNPEPVPKPEPLPKPGEPIPRGSHERAADKVLWRSWLVLVAWLVGLNALGRPQPPEHHPSGWADWRLMPDELVQRGAAYVIAKPFHLDELANILRLVAQGVPADLLPSGGVC